MPKILFSDFEVFGIVQGVSFRMFTELEAKKLGVRGWCKNTKYDTVAGQIEGPCEAFRKMQTWLKNTGSPTSRIDKTVFSAPIELEDYTFETFQILYD